MRRLAFAAMCGVCVLFAATATDAGTRKAAIEKGARTTGMDVNELKQQIPKLQQIGEAIAQNREAFLQLKQTLQGRTWDSRRAAKAHFDQRGQKRWSPTKRRFKKPQRDQRRFNALQSSAKQRVQRSMRYRASNRGFQPLTPARVAYLRRLAQQQNRPEWKGATATNTRTKKMFSQKPAFCQSKTTEKGHGANAAAENEKNTPRTFGNKEK